MLNPKPLIGVNSSIQMDGKYSSDDLRARDFYKIQSRYVDAIAKARGVPVIVPCFNDPKLLNDYVMNLDGFIFAGGADLPPELYGQVRNPNVLTTISSKRAENDIFLARTAMQLDIPILGICLGCQLLNVAAGGELIQHLETSDKHRSKEGDTYHQIKIERNSRLLKIFGTETITVNSAHHQAVKPTALGTGFSATAFASDGTIEAIEKEDKRFVMGVQWHPERINDNEQRRKFFSAFIVNCANKKKLYETKQN